MTSPMASRRYPVTSRAASPGRPWCVAALGFVCPRKRPSRGQPSRAGSWRNVGPEREQLFGRANCFRGMATATWAPAAGVQLGVPQACSLSVYPSHTPLLTSTPVYRRRQAAHPCGHQLGEPPSGHQRRGAGVRVLVYVCKRVHMCVYACVFVWWWHCHWAQRKVTPFCAMDRAPWPPMHLQLDAARFRVIKPLIT